MRTFVFSILLLFYLPLPAFANVDCINISDNDARLSCYDNKYRPKAATSKKGVWKIRTDTSKIDDSKSVFMMVSAIKPYTGSHGQKHLPTLWIRCLENKTALIINSDGDYLSDSRLNPKTVLRIDKSKARKFNLSTSTDNKAAGFWGGGSSIPFIKSMFGGSELLVQWTPVSDSPQTFVFPIARIEEVIVDLRKECGW